MFFGLPRAHVDADFGDQAERSGFTNAIDLRQVDAADSERFLANVKVDVISLFSFEWAGGLESGRGVRLRFQGPDVLRNLLIAFCELFLVMVKCVPMIASAKTGARGAR